jgi:predicted permease
MACVVASKFGANERFVAGVVFISTLMSIATIPLTLAILGAH